MTTATKAGEARILSLDSAIISGAILAKLNEIATIRIAIEPMRVDARLKILYILGISVPVLLFDFPYLTIALLAFQAIVWIFAGIQAKKIRAFRKGAGFIFLILFFYSFFHEEGEKTDLFTIAGWNCRFFNEGFLLGLLMVGKIITMLSATLVVRFTTPSEEFISALRKLGMPRSMSVILDSILMEIGNSRGSGQKKSRQKSEEKSSEGRKGAVSKGKDLPLPDGNPIRETGKPMSIKSILRGDLSPVAGMINSRLSDARAKFGNDDLAVISAFSIVVSLLRLINFAPGLPLAPGHKNLLIVPFLILTARMTNSPWGAATVGFLSGTVQFLSGYGKYGPFNILQFMIPGIVIDFLVRITGKINSVFLYALIGLIAGAARVSAEIALALIVRVPDEFFLVYSPMILSQCLFGAASAPVTRFLIRHVTIGKEKETG